MSSSSEPSSHPRIAPHPLRYAYLRTVIWVEIDGRTFREDEAIGLIGPVWVVTAWNPYSVELDDEANDDRHRRLVDAVDELGARRWDAWGVSVDKASWADFSLAISGIDEAQARALAHRFEQHAVFEMQADGLVVHGCSSEWSLKRPYTDPRLRKRADKLPVRHDCVSYVLGHHPHWIQAKLSHEGEHRFVHVTVGDEGWLELTDEQTGAVERRWTHDPDRTRLMVEPTWGRALLRSHGVLVPPEGSGPVVSIARESSPCPSRAALEEAGTPWDRLMTLGSINPRI
jgi:hypothetical protein